MIRITSFLVLTAALSAPASGQYRQLFFCEEIAAGSDGFSAHFIVYADPVDSEKVEQIRALRVCLIRDEGPPSGCVPIFNSPNDDLVAAQWVGAREIAVETRSLLNDDLRLHITVRNEGDVVASTMRLLPNGSGGRIAGDDEFAGDRTLIGEEPCRLATPPTRTVQTQLDR